MNTKHYTTQLHQFRQELYSNLTYRPDATMDLIDSLSTNSKARSVVELSLSPFFRRSYSSVTDSIDNFFSRSTPEKAGTERLEAAQKWMRIISHYLEPPKRKFWLFGIDVTPAPRRFSSTLEDRVFVYQPNAISGNQPVTIGHQFSFLSALPEKEERDTPSWTVPLLVNRVTSKDTATKIATQQTEMLLTDKTLPFYQKFCVNVVDSAYSAASYLGRVQHHKNLVVIARLRGNRTLYREPKLSSAKKRGKAHPTWYGKPFSLKKPETWHDPNQSCQFTYLSRRNKEYTVKIEAWHNLLMTGKQDIPLHQYPFTLVRIRYFDAQGREAFKRPLWLIVMGKRRHELSLSDIWESYQQRYDLEHFFRFGKQHLLMAAYQTPEVEHEENWWQIVSLVSVQLYLARHLAQAMPNSWEKYLSTFKSDKMVASPTRTLRDFGRIIGQIGTPAKVPKPRGKSPGR
ncbi:MAG: transposase, partial [Candidatus Diapherotrites archaeon]